ncbi:sulfite exporter TauE/SafE family protein [Shewanella sp. OPT22]|nr:sulfite exporter TauE/SafE family protein [Shewanella sp. OPT22]
MVSLFLVFVVSFIAFSISAVSGGGAGLVLIPILGQVLNSTHIPVAITIGTATSSLSRIIIFYKNIKWFMVKWIVLASIPGIALGAFLLSYLDPALLKLALSLFLISNLFMIFKKPENDELVDTLPNWILAIVGLSVGLISSLVGAVGVLFNRIYFRYNLNNEEVIATRAANEIVIHIMKICMYTWLGILTSKAVLVGGLVALAAISSTLLVKLFIDNIPKKVFIKLGYTVMVISGLFMFSDATGDINMAHSPDLKGELLADGGKLKLLWDGQLYHLNMKVSKGLEFSKPIALSELTHYTRYKVSRMCRRSESVSVNKIYNFNKPKYEVFCTNWIKPELFKLFSKRVEI